MEAETIEIVERVIFKEEIAFINNAKNKDRLSYNKKEKKIKLLYDDLSFLQLKIKILQKYYKHIKIYYNNKKY